MAALPVPNAGVEATRTTMAVDSRLQSLKYLVDTHGSSDSTSIISAIKKTLDKHDIEQSVWLEALRYAERLIDAVETELRLFADRVLELADVMPYKRTTEPVSKAQQAKDKGKRAQASGSLQTASEEEIAGALKQAIAVLVEKETVREALRAIILRWLDRARKDEVF